MPAWGHERRMDSMKRASAFPSTADVSLRCREPTLRANKRCDIYDFVFASGLATSRAHFMKSCASGLSVRFLSVTTPAGTGGIGNFTGRALRRKRLPLNFKYDPGSIVRKRPVLTRVLGSWVP